MSTDYPDTARALYLLALALLLIIGAVGVYSRRGAAAQAAKRKKHE